MAWPFPLDPDKMIIDAGLLWYERRPHKAEVEAVAESRHWQDCGHMPVINLTELSDVLERHFIAKGVL